MSSVTTVLGNGDSNSCLNGRAAPPLATKAGRRDDSSSPSSRSKRHSRACFAISTRISRLAMRATTDRSGVKSVSSRSRSSASSSDDASAAAFTTRSKAVV